MSEKFNQYEPNTESEEQSQDLVAMIKKVQQHLAFLEKKIDTLLNQSSERSSFKSRPPFRHSRPHHGRSDRGHGFGGHSGNREHGSGDFRQDRSFDRHPRGDNRGGFGRKKKFFKRDRD